MFELHEKKPQYTHLISRDDFRQWEDLIHGVAMEYEHDVVMLADGDYYFLVRFSPFYQDTTSVEELMSFVYGEREDVEYPFTAWKMLSNNPYGLDFYEYVNWMLLIRHIQANVPPGFCFDGILAFDMSQ